MRKASIIIVTYGQAQLTAQCLRSLERCLGDRLRTDWELVLIDNASPDEETRELLHSWSDRAVVKLLPANRNFAGGNNVGAAEAHGEVLIFLNSDTEVTPGALETLVEQALEPGISVAGCRLLFPDGTLQHAGVAFLHGEALGGAAMPQHVFHHQDPALASANAIFELDAVTAACVAVRASTFHAVGGFDEGYINGLEDIDLCLRIREAGEGVVYRGDATIVHHEGASRGKGSQLWATPARAAAMRSNDLRFVGAWAAKLDQDDELAAQLWDAALENRPPNRVVRTADLVVLGQPSGIGPAADEGRAFLAALTGYGEVVATGDCPVPIVVPRLEPIMTSLLLQSRRRLPLPNARWIVIPAGHHDPQDVHPRTTARLASARTAMPLHEAEAVWATSPAVADDVIAAGLPAANVVVVPPPIIETTPGPGGAGVLVVLPVHNRRLAGSILDSLGALPPSIPLRLLPTTMTRHLHRHIAELLPRAELLPPCADEARFAKLAAVSDVVVALDPSDRFERRALVAAGVGAAALTGSDRGPAAAVLGPGVAAGDGDLAFKLRALASEPGHRDERSYAVERECSPKALAPIVDLRSIAAH